MEKINNQNFIVHLSLGTNLGNRLSNLQKAVRLIQDKIGSIDKKSSVYENPPLGFEAEIFFYNVCVSVKTKLSPKEVLIHLQAIEKKLGRTKKTTEGGFTSRIIDIDLILFENQILDLEDLKIPHPLFSDRKFVLLPLNEIASESIDPISKQSISDILKKCKDKSALNIVKGAIF